MSRAFLFILTAVLLAPPAYGKICPRCGRDHLPNDPPAPKVEPPKEKDPPKAEPEENAPTETPVESLAVTRERFYAPSIEIADACDEILDRLEERYGKPKSWVPFPIYFRAYTGNGVAGYTQYLGDCVGEVVVYESLETAVGGTLDHELTHAFFFYLLGGNFDLFLNEGTAQNSEYRRREALRQTVYRRYNAGEFWDLESLYGRNQYDGGLRIYHEGFSVVDFLIGRGGSQWFAAFLADLQRSQNIDRELRRYYGYTDIKALQAVWLRFVVDGQDRGAVNACH